MGGLESQNLLIRIKELECAIKEVVSNTNGDNICWMDVYTKLGKLVGVTFDPTLIPPQELLFNCRKFVQSIYKNAPEFSEGTYHSGLYTGEVIVKQILNMECGACNQTWELEGNPKDNYFCPYCGKHQHFVEDKDMQ